jgi:hypothetical protein
MPQENSFKSFLTHVTCFINSRLKLAARNKIGWFLAWVVAMTSGSAVYAQSTDIPSTVNEIFSHRLENTLRYQEAVGPLGVARGRAYVQIGRRQFLLETLQTLSPDSQRVREDYLLDVRQGDTLSVSTARYAITLPRPWEGYQARIGVFHAYSEPFPIGIEAGQVLLRAEFNPLALLSLQPGAARVGQQVWVLNSAYGLHGDTLACYKLLPAPEQGQYLMALYERRTRGNRHWRHNNRLTYQWLVDPGARQVEAAEFPQPGPNSWRWLRTYTSETDFSETCSSAMTSPRGMIIMPQYSRVFTRKSAKDYHDIYTITNYETAKPALTFSVIFHYE